MATQLELTAKLLKLASKEIKQLKSTVKLLNKERHNLDKQNEKLVIEKHDLMHKLTQTQNKLVEYVDRNTPPPMPDNVLKPKILDVGCLGTYEVSNEAVVSLPTSLDGG